MAKNQVRLTKKIACNTCGCSMTKVKTFFVTADTKDEMKAEAGPGIAKWLESLEGLNCKVCQSIIDDVQKELKE